MSDKPLATAFIVDDDLDMRGSLEFLIQSAGIPTCSFPSAIEFLTGFDASRPGCLVCDVRMPEMTGLELLERLSAMRSPLPVILMTAHADVPMAVRALKLGAAEFVEKPFNPQLLLERVQYALMEDNGRRVSQEIWHEFAQRMQDLSDKERSTLMLIITGAPNKAIAGRLELSERAIEERRASIMKKLNVNSLAELVRQVTTFELLFPHPHPRLLRTSFDESQE
ncbi:response regulator transcription factor [Schlesneria paludicola]|uniref:response regulator transcription factor n=1 Tax=Schlesneria paludicola TaxID=360056 RepID=UPI0007C4E720|nr:response regulator [Schlesneria paludicola]